MLIRARRRSRHALVCLAVVGSLAAAGVSAASAQGLFETLFGMRFQEPAPPLYHPPRSYPHAADDWRNHQLRQSQPPRRGMWDPHGRGRPQASAGERRFERARPALGEPAKPSPYVAPPAMPGVLGRFLRDPTLRPGDVVATTEGLMVFRGSGGSRHAERDFVPLSRAGSLVARDARAELAKLDRALDHEPQSPASGREAPIVAQDKTRAARR